MRWKVLKRRLGRRLEAVAKAVGGGYCRLQMPLKPALGVRGTVAGHRLGALEGVGGVPPSNASLCIPRRRRQRARDSACPANGTSGSWSASILYRRGDSAPVSVAMCSAVSRVEEGGGGGGAGGRGRGRGALEGGGRGGGGSCVSGHTPSNPLNPPPPISCGLFPLSALKRRRLGAGRSFGPPPPPQPTPEKVPGKTRGQEGLSKVFKGARTWGPM